MTWDDDLQQGEPAYNIAMYGGTPLRVVAGPGTGKTTALTRRVARLLEEGAVPERMLVVTYTRTAANDLKRELEKLAVSGVKKVDTGTLHSFCFRTLQKARVFDHTRRVARPLLDFEKRFLLEDLDNKEVFGGVHQRKKHIDALAAGWAREYGQELGELEDDDRLFRQELDKWLRFHDAMLLDELVPVTLNYLRSNPRAPERGQYDHVLVDEYQDLNCAEQRLIDLLAERGMLTVAGDEDQSIYEDFRYAHPEGISRFHETHPGTYDEPLGECRRCPQRVVTIANELIKKNTRREDRSLCVLPGVIEGDIYIAQWDNIQFEAEGIAYCIDAKIAANEFDPGEVLVLSPSRKLGYGVRDALRGRGVEACSFFTDEILEGQPKDLERCQAQEAFTLLTLVVRPDDKVALRCWLGFGKDNLRSPAYGRLQRCCSESGLSPRQALDAVCDEGLSIPYINASGLVDDRYRPLRERLEDLAGKTGREIFDELFPEGEEWAMAFRNLAEVEGFVEEWNAENILSALLASIIHPELPTDVPYVRVMSLHKSKGLNADHVIVIGFIEGLIPKHPKDDYTFERKQRFREEQRRLFYVAVTRPRKTLILSSVTELPTSLAYNMGVSLDKIPGNRYVVRTITSTFRDELGPEAPDVIPGEELIRQFVGGIGWPWKDEVALSYYDENGKRDDDLGKYQ